MFRVSPVAALLLTSLAACSPRPAVSAVDSGPLAPTTDGDPPTAGSSDRDRPPPVPEAPVPTWACQQAEGRLRCKTSFGLPTGGSGWRCQQDNLGTAPIWTCYGEALAAPTGSGWICVLDRPLWLWKCTRPAVAQDQPPGGGYWACWRGSKAGGTVCEKTKAPPTRNDSSCYPGQRKWCDGFVYDGWGTVACDSTTLTWKAKVSSNGLTILDCVVSPNGERPDTVCACYHFFTNFDCCERPDCVVPEGTSGQVCPASPGTLCSYCDPQKADCKDWGARCVVNNASESFCGKDCSPSEPCPTGYQCMQIKLQGNQTTSQCIPSDLSCYY